MTRLSSRRAACLCLTATLAGALAGCTSLPPPAVGLTNPQPVAQDGQDRFAGDAPDYTLRSSDVVSIVVFREPDFSIDSVEVGADGMISMPFLGPVKVAGLTPRGLEKYLQQRLAEGILKNPAVSVNVSSYGSHQVTLEGSVEKPGIYSFRPGTRLSGALSLAGGASRVAKLDQIAILRQLPDGMAVAKYDYRAVAAGTMVDPVLQPGDRVVVGLSSLSQFWQDFLKAVPLFAIFTRL